MTAAEKRRRAAVRRLLGGQLAHAELIRGAVERDQERSSETRASMLRSIDAKISRWRCERQEVS